MTLERISVLPLSNPPTRLAPWALDLDAAGVENSRSRVVRRSVRCTSKCNTALIPAPDGANMWCRILPLPQYLGLIAYCTSQSQAGYGGGPNITHSLLHGHTGCAVRNLIDYLSAGHTLENLFKGFPPPRRWLPQQSSTALLEQAGLMNLAVAVLDVGIRTGWILVCPRYPLCLGCSLACQNRRATRI